MKVGRGEFTYEWIDNWARIPETPSGRENGRTHGVVVTDAGHVMVFCQADPAVLIFDTSGKLISSWGDRFPGAHGMTRVKEGDTEYLWLTDQETREVVKTTLDGQTLMNLERAPHDWYTDGGNYSPTSVAVNEERFGGNGDIWVADAYGSWLIHRYDKSGQYIATLSGHRGEPGRFVCPHGIAFDYRSGEPELYVADRSKQRIQVFDAEGNYKRVIGVKTHHSPCGFNFQGEYCVVPQLFGRVDLLDKDDQLVVTLGDNGHASTQPGWPNLNTAGKADLIEPGKFNSPHAACFGPGGDIYVVEWLIGGRITKLEKV